MSSCKSSAAPGPDGRSRLCLFSVGKEAFPGKGFWKTSPGMVHRNTVITIYNLLTITRRNFRAHQKLAGQENSGGLPSSNDPHQQWFLRKAGRTFPTLQCRHADRGLNACAGPDTFNRPVTEYSLPAPTKERQSFDAGNIY